MSGLHVLFPLGFDSQLMGHLDYGHGKWCSSIVCNDGKRSSEMVTAQHRVLVVRGVHHHVRMPPCEDATRQLQARDPGPRRTYTRMPPPPFSAARLWHTPPEPLPQFGPVSCLPYRAWREAPATARPSGWRWD